MAGIEEARAGVESALDAQIAGIQPLTGGHSTFVVERLRLVDGRTVVLKAAERWRGSGEMLDAAIGTEIDLYSRVPQLMKWRPALLATVMTEGWRGFVMEDVDQPGRSLPPWSSADADAISVGLAAVHRETLDRAEIPGVIPYPPHNFWTRAADEGVLSTAWRTWAREMAVAASAVIASSAASVTPRCVTHGDVYDNNIVLLSGRLQLIDWAQVAWTSPARDAVSWALSAETWSGIGAATVLQTYERYAGEQPVPDRRAALAVATGFIVLRLGQVAPGSDQHRYLLRRLDPAATWLAQELDVAPPPPMDQ